MRAQARPLRAAVSAATAVWAAMAARAALPAATRLKENIAKCRNSRLADCLSPMAIRFGESRWQKKSGALLENSAPFFIRRSLALPAKTRARGAVCHQSRTSRDRDRRARERCSCRAFRRRVDAGFA